MSKGKITRRQLMQRAAVAAGVFTIVPRHVLGGKGYTPPSEELTKAMIGTGGMGRNHVTYGGTRLLAVCDVDSEHVKLALEKAEENGFNNVAAFRDFRELLANVDADIIHIGTPPHWHALICIAAAQEGKDIWCEKPMTRTIEEGEKVVQAVQQHGRIFRVNSFARIQNEYYGSEMTAKVIKKIIDNDLLGRPLKMTLGKATGFDWKLDQWSGKSYLAPEPIPPQIDYDLWLGPAPYKPYNPKRVHSDFRGYWDYDGGGLGDMGQHYLDPAQYVLGKDNDSPIEIEAEAPQQHPDAAGYWTRIRMKYKDGTELVLDGTDNKDRIPLIEGPKGKLYPKMESDIPDLAKKLEQLPDPPPLNIDFIECVRERKKHALNEANVHRSCTLVNLAKIAVRVQRPLHFDPKTQRFVNDEAANRLVAEPMRAPWHL